ncbi:MAG: cytochrome c family protein [Elusimicrobiota bacterium]|nr:MAG: cytochrome c family protein [Elusimicrobiota bacterium]
MKRWLPVLSAVAAISAIVYMVAAPKHSRTPVWEHQASPGALSKSHAFLKNDCASCHTSGKGIEPAKCISCHANDLALLQSQPTAFHASIGSCVECHVEHQGVNLRPVKMNHEALADVGLKNLKRAPPGSDDEQAARIVKAYFRQGGGAEESPFFNHSITPKESALNCASCHATKDVHRQQFGSDCASCHGTAQWTIAEFQHPPPRSMDCAQCHQAPPSHYMMHFQMISMKIATQPKAAVSQCFKCHQTTSWNDIKGIGWYKHH